MLKSWLNVTRVSPKPLLQQYMKNWFFQFSNELKNSDVKLNLTQNTPFFWHKDNYIQFVLKVPFHQEWNFHLLSEFFFS